MLNPIFNPTTMVRTSVAASTICKWVKAMDAYQKGRKVRTRTAYLLLRVRNVARTGRDSPCLP